jgi:eukaryotic-like serine/threonine-protein kinase
MVTPDEWHRITTLFHAALARDAAERAAWLRDACGTDDVLRAGVERLLAAHERAGSFGDVPLVAPPPEARTDPAAVDGATTDSPPRRRHPFIYAVWLAAALVLAAFTYAAWLLLQHGGAAAWHGWREQPGDGAWYVTSVDANGPAAALLRVGDRIVVVADAPPFDVVGTAPHRRRLARGEELGIVVERAGERVAGVLRVGTAGGWPRLVERITYFVSSLLWCLIGLWIGAARPENPVARLAAAVAVAVGLLFLSVGVYETPPHWGPLHVVLGYHFFARFPTGALPGQGWRVALWGLYLVGAVSVASGLGFEALALARGLAAAAPYDWLLRMRESLAMIGFAGAVAGMAAVLARNYIELTTEDQRRRVRWVVYAACVGLAPQVWWAIIGIFETFVAPAPVPRLTLIANITPVVIPLSVAYVVVRHQVLDIRVVVRRTVQYLLARRVLQAAVALPLLALLYTVVRHRDFTIAQLVVETREYLYWLGAAGLALSFRGRLGRWLDRRFFRAEFDREQLLLALLDDVRRVDSMPELARVVNDRLSVALHPSCTHVWYRDPAELAQASATDPALTPPDVPAGESWTAWLEQRGEAVALPAPAEAGLTRRELQWFKSRGVSLVVPIMDSGDRLVGALLLGEKLSEEPYTAGDARLLGTIARQMGVARDNLRLRARVGEEVRIKHDVLARLDRHIPGLLRECPGCGACFDDDRAHCPADGHRISLSLPVTRTIDGKYRLDRLLGKGGMGAVYEAHDLRLARTVAVKIMLGREFGQQAALRRFQREARATARLNHPNIVAVYDYGPLPGDGAYLVMERVHGATLRAELARCRTLSPTVAAAWFDPLLDGRAAANDAGIVHRDLKPENVMGRHAEGARVAVKILDLGLVKVRATDGVTSAAVTAAGVIMGTPSYMAPEQLLGLEVDERADIFAIGIMLVEALTGTRPQAALDPRRAAALASWADELPAAFRTLHDVIARCLAAEPADRTASAAALHAELIPLLRGLPALHAGA